MENIPEAITAKEGKEIELKNIKQYNLNFEKDIFEVKIGKKENESIIIRSSKTNKFVDCFYEKKFTFDELVKLDKTFKAYDELEEIFQTFIVFFNEKKVIIKEEKDDTLLLALKIMSMTGKEKIVELNLYKKEMKQDSLVKDLCKKINLLEEEVKNIKEENKNLKEEFKNMKKELDDIKSWKNENDAEIKKFIEEKKDIYSLKNIDTKILKKKEELELIEKAYKNNVELLMNKNFRPKLLYRATRDGDSAKCFS